jgi:hypothetical protein
MFLPDWMRPFLLKRQQPMIKLFPKTPIRLHQSLLTCPLTYWIVHLRMFHQQTRTLGRMRMNRRPQIYFPPGGQAASHRSNPVQLQPHSKDLIRWSLYFAVCLSVWKRWQNRQIPEHADGRAPSDKDSCCPHRYPLH